MALLRLGLCLGISFSCIYWGEAAELGSSKVTALRNCVDKYEGEVKRPAAVGDAVVQGDSITTKENALVELSCSDSSIVRLGENSVFSYNSKERLVTVDKGTFLMHTPPGGGGVTITSGGVTGAISGTTFMVTATPAKCGTCAQELIVDKQGKVRCAEHPEIKPVGTGGFALLVLESTSGTKVTGPDGKSTEISPGQMAVLGGKAGAGPQVFTVSLAQVLRSSPLVNAFPQPLPSLGAILTTATQQQSLVASGSTRTTGTSGVAITSGGSLLAASSPPPTPAPISFVMASSTPGYNGGNSPSNARVGNPLDINTASGGIGGNTTVVNGGGPAGGFGGSVGGGAGGGGANPPSNTGQSGITANPNNPNNQNATPPTSVSVVSASVTPKVYDGTTTATISGASASVGGVGLVNETTGVFASKNVGSSISVATAISLTDLVRYSLTGQPSLFGDITAKALTMTGSIGGTKVYDGSRTALVTLGTLSGEVTGETLGTSTVVGTFNSKDVVGASSITAVYTLVNGASGELASNYSLGNDSLASTITAKAVTISVATPSTVTSKVYNGNRVASVTVGAVDGVIAGEVLGATTAVGTFVDKNIGTKSVMATYTLVDGVNPLHLASNYSLASETLSGTITAKDLSVFSAAVTTKAYDGNDAAVVTGAVLVGNSTTDIDGKFIGTETVTLNGGTAGTFASKNVGAGQAVTTAMTLGGSDSGNYTLSTQPTLTGTIQAKGLSITSPSIAAKVYNGSAAAGVVTLGTLTGFVGTETVTASGTAANYSSENVGSYSSAITYALADGLNGGLASNYSLAAGSATGVITAKGLSITSPSIASKVYNGSAAAGVVTVGTLSGFVGSETVTASGLGADYSSANVGTYNGVAVGYTLGNGSNGGLASNYSLAAGSATGVITAKALTMTGSSAGNKVYDGTVTAAVALGTQSGEVAGEALGTTTVAGTFADRNVGPAKSVAVVYTLVDGANAAANYSLANDTLSANITAKALTVAGGAVTTKAYDGTTVATITGAGLQSAIAAGTGSSTDGKSYSVDSVTLAGGSTGTFERNLPGTLITVSTTMSVAGSGAGNYTLTQPTTLKGEITGSANLNRNGAAITVSSADYVHIRDTTAIRMQDGLTISSSTGGVLLENSSFDGWMQRSTPNTKIDDGGVVTFQFTETASTAVNSPVLRLKMEANDPANVDMNKQFMLLGDYQVLLRRDPNGVPGSGDEVAQTLFSFPGSVDDPSGIGSLAPSADLVIRDSASTQMKDLSWDTKEYSSLDGSGGALDSGNYASVSGEFKGDNAASALDIATSSGGAAGTWDVVVSDPILGGEGKVTDLRLKYNNNTKALIQGPNGVRLVNVIFEGMDAVEVAAGLNDKVLMSGTLVSDPNIGKMVVKAGQTLEAQFASDATMKEVRTSAGNAEILAGVVKDSASPTGYSFLSGPNRVLEMQSATIAGQLSLASHTIVFNNANITSGGVIDARSRDGMVNRTYGSVVPGTVSFMGTANNFLNTANSASMSIANSGNIVSALSGGQMRENGVGGATVMNVGRVR